MLIAASAETFRDTPVGSMVIVLLTAAVVAMVMQRLRVAVVPAYLVAGAIVGPGTLGFVRDPGSLGFAADLAIVLLMFSIGLHLDVAMIRRDLKRLLSAGAGGVIAVTLALWPVAMAFGLGAPAALAVAMALSMSSTAVVMRLLSGQDALTQVSGRMAVAVSIMQDLASIAMVASIPLLAAWGGVLPQSEADPGGAPLWARVLVRFGAVVLLVALGKATLPLLLREAAREKSGEVLIVLSVAIAVGASALMQALGLSKELGAFLSGFLLSATPFKHQLSGAVGPARDLLVAMFFTTIGMLIRPAFVIEAWWEVLLGTAAVLLVKAVAQATACWVAGATAAAATLVALALAQVGEFSLVIMRVAHTSGLLTEQHIAVGTAVCCISQLMTPAALFAGRKSTPLLSKIPHAPWLRTPPLGAPGPAGEGAAAEKRPHVIIAGFGPVGRAVAEQLDTHGIDYTIVEMNPATVRAQTELGRRVVYGDAANAAVLESAGLRDARALVLTVPDDEAVLRATSVARAVSPDIFIAARTSALSRAHLAWGLGANQVISDEVACADAMRRAVLSAIQDDTGYALSAGMRRRES